MAKLTVTWTDGRSSTVHVDPTRVPEATASIVATPGVVRVDRTSDEAEVAAAIRSGDVSKLSTLRPAWFN